MPNYDFNKVALQLRHGCSPVNLLHISRIIFLKNTSGRLLLIDDNSDNEIPLGRMRKCLLNIF